MNRGPQNTPKYILVLIIGATKMGPLIFGQPFLETIVYYNIGKQSIPYYNIPYYTVWVDVTSWRPIVGMPLRGAPRRVHGRVARTSGPTCRLIA